MKKPRVAFVVQRYGQDVAGGAEAHCRLLAEHMSPYWDVEVLTSCARDYRERFLNDYPPGDAVVNGVRVKRFEIDYFRSEDSVFAELDRKALSRTATREEEQLWLKEIGPYSSSMIDYIRGSYDFYDLFVFLTYLYSTTTLILPHVRQKAVLAPTAHDESPIYARIFDDFFALPRMLIFNTPEERDFLHKRADGRIAQGRVVGVGIDPPRVIDGNIFRETYNIRNDYFLYVGRVQKEKNCDELIAFYAALPEALRKTHSLVLVGARILEIPDLENVHAVGFLSEELKYSALSNAKLMIMPSKQESLNMAIMESWLCGAPVLVNGRCEVLKQQCIRSNGGLWYESQEDFEMTLEFLTDPRNARICEAMARNGKRYVQQNYSWEIIESNYKEILELCGRERA